MNFDIISLLNYIRKNKRLFSFTRPHVLPPFSLNALLKMLNYAVRCLFVKYFS